MELNEEWLDKAVHAWHHSGAGTIRDSIASAIETYLTELFKPGQVQMLEPLEAIPQRDYRKELWIGIRLQDADIAEANAALADFDKTFPPEPTHG